MKKGEIRKLARQKIKEGKSQQEVFEALLQLSNNPAEDIARIIQFIPDLEKRKKYKIAQAILILVLVLTILLKTVSGLRMVIENGVSGMSVILLIPVISIVLIYGIATYQGYFYRLAGILAVIGFMRTIEDIIREPLELFLLIDVGIAGAIIGLSFYLNAKMIPAYTIIKEKYTNQQGQPRLRNKIKFIS